MQHLLHFITDERLAELHTALNRAANTWEDAPAWVIELTDALHAGQVSCQALQRQLIAAEETLTRLGYTYHGGQLWKPPLDSFDALKSKRDELLDLANRLGHARMQFVDALEESAKPSYELHPYQREAMDTLSKGLILNPRYRGIIGGQTDHERVGVEHPADGTMSPTISGEDDILEPSFDYLPEWAERKVAPGEDGYVYPHAQLMTRDGRRSGNAVIARFEASNVVVLTDMGNEMVMNREELEDQFYPPVYIVKNDCVGKRLAKSHDEPNPTKALYTVGYNAEGERVTWCVRSSEDPCKDQDVMNAALELVQAITLRNVPITPEVLYKHLVGIEYAAHPDDKPAVMTWEPTTVEELNELKFEYADHGKTVVSWADGLKGQLYKMTLPKIEVKS